MSKELQEISRILSETPMCFIATMDGTQPRVRAFQFQFEQDGKLWFCTARNKDVFKQLLANPAVEICAVKQDMTWLRLTGKMALADDMAVKERVLAAQPLIKASTAARTTRCSPRFALNTANTSLPIFPAIRPARARLTATKARGSCLDAGTARVSEGTAMTDQDNAGKELRDKIEMYRESIIHADKPELAEQVWDTAPETSFIHPRGHERGWEAIRDNFYTKTMANTFSRRELRLTGEPVVHLYGDAAVAEFDWEFTATRRATTASGTPAPGKPDLCPAARPGMAARACALFRPGGHGLSLFPAAGRAWVSSGGRGGSPARAAGRRI